MTKGAYKKQTSKRGKAQKTLFIVVAVLFSIYGFTLVYPFFWTLINSLKTNREFSSTNSLHFPKNGCSPITKTPLRSCPYGERICSE